MFYRLILYKDVELHPKFFGPNMRDTLKAKVTAEARQKWAPAQKSNCRGSLLLKIDMLPHHSAGGRDSQWKIWLYSSCSRCCRLWERHHQGRYRFFHFQSQVPVYRHAASEGRGHGLCGDISEQGEAAGALSSFALRDSASVADTP